MLATVTAVVAREVLPEVWDHENEAKWCLESKNDAWKPLEELWESPGRPRTPRK